MLTSRFPLRMVICICLLQLIACTKSIDRVHPDSMIQLPMASDATVANEYANCKLRRIVHENPFVSESTVNCLFSYNSAGNPYSLVHTGPLVIPTSGYNTLNYYFYYNKKNQLRELYINFVEDRQNQSEYTELHRYGYDNNDKIIADTLLGLWQGDFTELTPKRISRLTYDNQGRIIKENIQDFYRGTTRNPTYTYDNRGNLAVPGWKSSGYDNKVSIFRAHPLFQFIHRNYSKNNALPETKYNSKGLPLAVRQLNDDFFGAYRTNPTRPSNPLGGIIKAVYDCQ